MTSIMDCIASGLLRLAQEPPEQPTLARLREAPQWTIPLIAHDYPARTSRLWNAVYRNIGSPHVNAMVVADPARVDEIVAVLRGDRRYLGGGCGDGFKEVVIPHLDDVDEVARAMGAANIIYRRESDDALVGSNTDGQGFVRGLQPLLKRRLGAESLIGVHTLVLSAGGAGRAIAFALAREGAHVTIANRTVEKAVRLASDIAMHLDIAELRHGGNDAVAIHEAELTPDLLARIHVIVNPSNKGKGDLAPYSALAPAPIPVTPDAVAENHRRSRALLAACSPNAVVADIAAFGAPTVLLQHAAERGLATQDAIPMVVEQAIDAFGLVHPGLCEPREARARIMWATEGVRVAAA